MKRCATSGKKKFKARIDAVIFEGLVINRIHGAEQRAYCCPDCGFWHLASKRRRWPV